MPGETVVVGKKEVQINLSSPVAVPGYAPGDQKGGFTVLFYLGHSMANPETGKHLSKRQHWYEVSCSCGNKEVLNQAQVNSRNKCLECTADQKGRKISDSKRALRSGDVPNFASMRWK